MRGEPIVASPVDALLCFAGTGIDALVLEDFLIDREAVPDEILRTLVNSAAPADVDAPATVYTFF